jgi:hypothetical protein
VCGQRRENYTTKMHQVDNLLEARIDMSLDDVILNKRPRRRFASHAAKPYERVKPPSGPPPPISMFFIVFDLFFFPLII